MADDISVLGIQVETKGVKEGSDALDKLTQSGAGAEVATEKLTNKIAGLAAVAKASAAAFGVFKISEYAKDSTLLAARYETLGVAMVQIGRNVGYSAEQMDSFATGVQRAGISMLESRATLTQMAQAHINLADATKLAAIAQGAAVVAGINSSEAMGRMIQGIQSGQTETLRTIGLNVNFEASYTKLAKSLGLNVALLTESEKAQARANAVLEKGGDLAGVYEKAMGTAGKQMGSLARYAEDLSVKLGGAFLEAFTDSIFGQSEGLKALGKAMDDLANNGSVEKFGHSLASGISEVTTPISSATKLLYEHRSAVEMMAGAYLTLKLGAFAGPMIEQYAAATAASVQYRSAILSGSAVEIGSAKATLQKAAATVESASANVAAATAERALIVQNLALVASEREIAISNLSSAASAQVQSAAMADLAALGKFQTAQNIQLAASSQALAAAQAESATATAALAAAQSAASISGRAASAAGSALSVATAALGGPIGVVIALLGTAAVAWSLFGEKGSKAVADVDAAMDLMARKSKERKFGTGDVGTLSAGAAGANAELSAINAKIKEETERAAGLSSGSGGSESQMVRASAAEFKISRLKVEAEKVSAKIASINAEIITTQAATDKLATGSTGTGTATSSGRMDMLSKEYAPKITKAQTLAALAAAYKEEQGLAKGNSEKLLALDATYNQTKKEIDDRFKTSGSGVAAEAKSTLSLDLDKIKKASDEEVAIYTASDRIMSAMRSANMVDDSTYYEWKSANIKKLAEAEEGSLQQQIDRMNQEKLTGKAAIDNAKAILDAEAKLKTVRDEANTALVVNGFQASASINNIAKAYANAAAAAEEYLATVKRQNARELSGIGAGTAYRKEQSDQNKIEDKYLTKKATLDTFIRENPGSAEKQQQYDNELALAKATYDAEVEEHASSRSKIMAKEADWSNGMTEAMANYAESARNASARANEAFTNSFKSMEDALTDFVMTGKFSFKDLATSITKEAVKVMSNRAVASMIGMVTDLFIGAATSSSSSSGSTVPGYSSGTLGNGISIKHSGGIVGTGEGDGFRSVDMRVFNGASKYHTGGIVDGEVPIIAKRGEGVFTPGQMAAMGGKGGDTVSISLTVNEADGSAASKTSGNSTKAWSEFSAQMKEMILAQMANEKRPGGMLY